MLWFIHHNRCTAAWLLQPCAGHNEKRVSFYLIEVGWLWLCKQTKHSTISTSLASCYPRQGLHFRKNKRNSFSSYHWSFITSLSTWWSIFDHKKHLWLGTESVNLLKQMLNNINRLLKLRIIYTETQYNNLHCHRQAYFPVQLIMDCFEKGVIGSSSLSLCLASMLASTSMFKLFSSYLTALSWYIWTSEMRGAKHCGHNQNVPFRGK